MRNYLLLGMFLVIILVLSCTTLDHSKAINSFEECLKAGSPVMESYPRQCKAGDRTFVEEIDEKPIGGERDEHGCLGPAGYTWNEDVGACIREWELEKNQKKAAKIAVDHIGYTNGLTVIKVNVARCTGCFAIQLNKDNKVLNINLKDWEAVSSSAKEPEKTIECVTDNDCITGGCSGTICQSKDSEPIFTTCEFLPEYVCYQQTTCSCINGKCQWQETEEFKACFEREKSLPAVV